MNPHSMFSSAPPPLLRGQALVNDLLVLRQLFGEEFIEEFFRRLEPAQQELARSGFDPARWYDEHIQLRLVQLVGERVSPSENFAVGIAIARHNINTLQRFLARLANPKMLLSRAAAIWSYWRDTGQMIVEDSREGAARVAVRGHALLVDASYATMYSGACGYMVSLTGAKNVRITAEPAAPSTVLFNVRWGGQSIEPGYRPVAEALELCKARGKDRWGKK